MKKFIVITTINGLTEGIRKFSLIDDWHVILVGDRKTPQIEDSMNITFLSVDKQLELGYHILDTCPFDHYARKNIGYLYAIERGADIIAETDDDNFPYEYWGTELTLKSDSVELVSSPEIVNIYRFFIEKFIWPRGFPLSYISKNVHIKSNLVKNPEISIWQGLVDIAPDVDAIYRLIFGEETLLFKRRNPIVLDKGVWSPFNSQNTIWSPKSFPFLYLPTTVSFRFTDILRSYITQKCLWGINSKIAFTSATVYQHRNPHNLMSDFIDELPCYIYVNKLIELLNNCIIRGNPKNDLRIIYQTLYKAEIVNREELNGVKAWIRDYEKIT